MVSRFTRNPQTVFSGVWSLNSAMTCCSLSHGGSLLLSQNSSLRLHHFHLRLSPPSIAKCRRLTCVTAVDALQEIQMTGDTPMPVPLLSTAQVISKIQDVVLNSSYHQTYRAMYSSIIGGIATDPAWMLIPLDDHMVHRGHGVFDTALISDGYLYELDVHLDRLLNSAMMAKIKPPFSRETMRKILVETVAASNCRVGSLRYWLSAGPGGFGLSASQCKQSSFYAVVLHYEHYFDDEGVEVTTSSIPMKPPQFATMKNVNYLPNALSLMEAEEKGAYAGIWVDDDGFVAEGPNMNVAFVSKEGELLMPPFDAILSGCTAKRTLALAQKLINETASSEHQQVDQLRRICVRPILVEEGKNAAEMMLLGSGVAVKPVVRWDQQQIGNGKPGPITLALQGLLRDDMLNGPGTLREPVPYKDGQ